MRAIVPTLAGIGGRSKAPALSPRAIEKTSASSALGREKRGAESRPEKTTPLLRVEHVYRDDTPRFDPIWDAPRLVPAFAAQLLGQAMPERRNNVSVETAYGRATSARKALVLDRKS